MTPVRQRHSVFFLSVAFASGLALGYTFQNVVRQAFPEAATHKTDRNAGDTSLTGGRVVGVPGPEDAPASTLRGFLGPDVCEVLEAKVLPEKRMLDFRLRLEAGRVMPEELSLFMGALATRWPQETLQYVETIDPKVVAALKITGLVLAKMARAHPETVVDFLAKNGDRNVSGQELYDIGLEMYREGKGARELFKTLSADLQKTLTSAETEAVMRRGGVNEMVPWVSSLKGSSIKQFDKTGKLVVEGSGPTSDAIDKMAELLRETSGVTTDDLVRNLTQAPWWGEPAETYSALKQLGRIDAAKALEVAGTLKGRAAEMATIGAFNAASEFHSEVALEYLSKITDLTVQNRMLSLLAQKTTDEQIRKECEEILTERGALK